MRAGPARIIRWAVPLAAFLAAGSPSFAEDTPEEQYALARSAFEDGLYAFALKRFERLSGLEKFSRADDSAIFVGKCRFQLGLFADAIRVLAKFPSSYPHSNLRAESRLWLGRAHLENSARQQSSAVRKKMQQRAAEIFAELAREKSVNRVLKADAEYFAARGRFEMHFHEDAAKMLRNFLEAHPDSPYALSARLLRGDALFRLYRFEGAVRELTVVLRSSPSRQQAQDARQLRGECYYCLKDWDRALLDYWKAGQLAQRDPGRLHQARYGAGWAIYQRAMERADDRERREDLEAALLEFLPVSKLPASERIGRGATFKVGQILLELERYREAIRYLKQCTPSRTFPDLHLQARYLLAKTNRKLGRHAQALSRLEEISRYADEVSLPQELALAVGQEKAEILSESGKPVEAAKEYVALRDATTEARTRAEMYFMAGTAYLNASRLGKERFIKARRIFEEIVSQPKLSGEISHSRLHYHLAWALHGLALEELRAGRARVAEGLLDLAVKRYSEVKAGNYARVAGLAAAGIHEKRNRPELACRIYEDLLAAGIADAAEKAEIDLACARANRSAGRRSRSLARLDNVLASDECTPSCRSEALLLKATCLAESGENLEAERTYAQFLRGFGTSSEAPGAALRRGELLVGLARRAEAIDSFDLSARLAGRSDAELAQRAGLAAAKAALESGRAAEARRRFLEGAAEKGEFAWESELALAGMDLGAGKPSEAIRRLSRILREAGGEKEITKRAAELAGRVHLASGSNEKAEKMFRRAGTSDLTALAARALAGLAVSLYRQNRFDEAAERYAALYLAVKDGGPTALREKAIKGAVSSLRRSIEGAPAERKRKLLGEAVRIAGLSREREWRESTLDDLAELQKVDE